MTNDFCQCLQQKSQDVINAMHLVLNIKSLIPKLKDDTWDNLLKVVQIFCKKQNIDVSNMNSHYVLKCGRHQCGAPL